MADIERLQMQKPYLCRDGIFERVSRWEECIIVLEYYGYKVVRLKRKEWATFNVVMNFSYSYCDPGNFTCWTSFVSLCAKYYGENRNSFRLEGSSKYRTPE